MAAAQQTGAPPAAGAGDGQGQAQPPADGARLDRLEQTQREQGAVLERVLAAVTGGAAGAHAAPGQGQQQGQPSAAEIAAQVRSEIADADQRRKAEEDDKTWRASITEVIEKVKAENAPREPQAGFRARLQRFVVGKEPG
jgi:hypothetical protein